MQGGWFPEGSCLLPTADKVLVQCSEISVLLLLLQALRLSSLLLLLLLQVVQPSPANREVYQEALQRHMQRGQRLFAPQQ
jgi:hypothetical protein